MRLLSVDVCMKNTSRSVVPFQVGENATQSRPPSPSVVTVLGTVPIRGVPPPLDAVVNYTELLGPEVLPPASRATTNSVNALPHARLVTVVEVAGGVPVTVLYTALASRMSYAVTPTLSVEPVQLMLTLLDWRLENVRLLGAVGGWVSELDLVVQVASGLVFETLPAASRANTERRYSVFGVRPVRFLSVAEPGASEILLPSW